MKIGIAITTHNRNERIKNTLEQIKKYSPKNAFIVIVDDASKEPVKEATFRFDSNVGIAVAKNKCIELLYDAGCTHLFLFDDDTYPIKKGWDMEYINSGINHLCMTFDRFKNGLSSGRTILRQKYGLVEYKEPCGCMLYLTREVVDKVGGMDHKFGKWGYEHVGYSMRIYNNFLTPRPFMDIENSTEWIYSEDWAMSVERSVTNAERMKLAQVNKRKYESEKNSDRFLPFKGFDIPKNVIITTLFHTIKDTQRNDVWNYEETLKLLEPLKESCKKHNIDLVILDDKVNIKPKHRNPYFARWIAIKEHLESNYYNDVFCVDATDVEVLRNPFESIQKRLVYVGCEPSKVNSNVWLHRHHKAHIYRQLYRQNLTLKNAGLLGGYSDDVLDFITKLVDIIKHVENTDMTDMALFNYVCMHLNHKIKYGDFVNTEFKAFKDNGIAWFKHK